MQRINSASRGAAGHARRRMLHPRLGVKQTLVSRIGALLLRVGTGGRGASPAATAAEAVRVCGILAARHAACAVVGAAAAAARGALAPAAAARSRGRCVARRGRGAQRLFECSWLWQGIAGRRERAASARRRRGGCRQHSGGSRRRCGRDSRWRLVFLSIDRRYGSCWQRAQRRPDQGRVELGERRRRDELAAAHGARGERERRRGAGTRCSGGHQGRGRRCERWCRWVCGRERGGEEGVH